MTGSVVPRIALGAAYLLSTMLGVARADPATYFPDLAADERAPFDDWLAERSSSYSRRTFVPSAGDPDDGAAVFWNVDGDAINFALAVRAEAGGWVGFGLSEAGGMIGSDVALFFASDPDELVDAHVVEDRSTPVTDDCQDWTLEGTPVSEDDWIIVEMSRLLDTKDAQDLAIKDDADLWDPPTRIIAAWGDGPFSYHGGKSARSSVRVFANHTDEVTEAQALMKILEEESDGYFDFLEDEFEIPAAETHYQELCMSFDEFGITDLPEGQSMVTMVGAVPVINEETAEYIHHFTVYTQKDCTPQSFLTQSMIYVWAPGDEGWALPENVGFPLFDEENNQAIFLQIHYNNPGHDTGKKDSSGVRFYYSHEERTHQAGMLEVGDPWLALQGQSVGEGLNKFEFTCPSACSTSFLSKEDRANGELPGVTVIMELLHMHQSGVRMTNEVIRDGNVHNMAVSDVYDFDQQGGHHVPQDPYLVMPGDSFRTTCYYRDGTTFGLGSQEEMCIVFLMYYPKMTSPSGQRWICPHEPFMDFGTGCGTELRHAQLTDDSELERSFGGSSGECAEPSSTEGDNVPAPDGNGDAETDADANTDPETDTDANTDPETDSDPNSEPEQTPEDFPEGTLDRTDDLPSSASTWSGAKLFLAHGFMVLFAMFI